MSKGRILITGATGFIGQTLIPVLKNNLLRVATRKPVSIPNIESVIIDGIDDSTIWDEALADVDCIIHLAARVHVMKPGSGDYEKFYQTNVLGTERMARAAVLSGVKKFIYLSSVKVNGELTSQEPFSSASVPNPEDSYGKSKYLAEQRLFELAKMTELSVIAIRPPLVYGDGVGANFYRLLTLVDRGYPLPLGAVKNLRSLVSVWNLCDLIRAVVERRIVESNVFLVSDGEDLSTPTLIRKIAAKMGRTSRLIPFPTGLIKMAGRFVGMEAEISRLCNSLTIDMSDTQRRLNWRPSLSVDESLERTIKWYLSRRN